MNYPPTFSIIVSEYDSITDLRALDTMLSELPFTKPYAVVEIS